jgi:LEA14-like dessication related protein
LKKILVVILLILIILNSIIGGFLLFNIQVLKTPNIQINLNPIEMTSEHILVNVQVIIQNPNPFDISIENITVITTSPDNYEIGRFSLPGDTIHSEKEVTYNSQDILGFSGHEYSFIKNRISMIIGISILGIIKKTIPLEMQVNISLSTIINSILIPTVGLNIQPDSITRDGVSISGSLTITNPNDFQISLENLSLRLKNEKNDNVGSTTLNGGIIQPHTEIILPLQANLEFIALDANYITANLTGVIGIKVAGIQKTLPLFVQTKVIVPNLKTLLSFNESFRFTLSGNFMLRIRGVLCNVEFAIFNPTSFPIDARNLTCYIYRIDNNATRLLGTQNMTLCTIEPKNEVCQNAQIILPYRKLLFSGSLRLLPDWFKLTIKGNLSLSGVKQAIPIEITGYLSPHFFMNRSRALSD